ncbi:glycogen debranching N-terminal domain-containing protein, partial [Micromonospora fulviviridis]
MVDETSQFFDNLGRRDRERLPRTVSGSVRFDLAHEDGIDTWVATIDKGRVWATRRVQDVDTVVRTDREFFGRLIRGEVRPVSAWMRNDITSEGDFLFVLLLDRLFPRPPSGGYPPDVARATGRVGQDTRLVRVLDGNTFVLSDGNGDIEASDAVPAGFYSFDIRLLSLWRLTVNGERLSALTVDDRQYFQVRFFLVPGSPTHYMDAQASIIRERSVGRSFDERLTVINHSAEPADFTIRLDVDSDFEALGTFRREAMGRIDRRVEGGSLRLNYRRDNFWRGARVSSTEPARFDDGGLTYHVRVGPHGQWTTTLHVESQMLRPDGEDVRHHLTGRQPDRDLQRDLHGWLDRAPQLKSDWLTLNHMYRHGLVDLAALRHTPFSYPNMPVPSAGLPWSVNPGGRDTILCSLQALPIAPELVTATLCVLGVHQGSAVDDFRDEEPGKMLREFRGGELGAFDEIPMSYYGAADTTPLYVILLDEYERWTGDAMLVRQLEETARAA